MAYAEVMGSAGTVWDQDSDSENEDENEQKKWPFQRYGKRCLLFVGDPDAKQRLLLWLAVGEPIMVIHYRFFFPPVHMVFALIGPMPCVGLLPRVSGTSQSRCSGTDLFGQHAV